MPVKAMPDDEAATIIRRILHEVLFHKVSSIIDQKGTLYHVQVVYQLRSDNPDHPVDERPEKPRVVQEPKFEQLSELKLLLFTQNELPKQLQQIAESIWDLVKHKTMMMIVGLGFRFSYSCDGKTKHIVIRPMSLGGHNTPDSIELLDSQSLS